MTDPIMKDEISEKFERILRKYLPVEENFVFQSDTVLEKVGLDSLSAVDLMLDLEDSFDIAFPDSMLTYDVFKHFSTLLNGVRKLIGEK